MTDHIFTFGYEGLSLKAFIARLKSARVETVIDVRANPLSRKPGFSKRAPSPRLCKAPELTTTIGRPWGARTRILILCKTYPSPSGKHVETSCVAGMEEGGQLIRLFPIPFRLIDDQKQFRKWQWVNCGLAKPPTIGKISRGRTGWLA